MRAILFACLTILSVTSTSAREARLPPSAAYASLTVVNDQLLVINRCREAITIAVRYRNARHDWVNTEFFEVGRGESIYAPGLTTDNDIFYYYASTASGRKWSGDLNRTIAGRVYPMRKTELKARADLYRLQITCNPG